MSRKTAFILLHMGENHGPSKEVLDLVNVSNVKGMTIINVTNDSTKSWLIHNANNIKVKDFPTFLIAMEGEQTIVHPASEASNIIGMLGELNE